MARVRTKPTPLTYPLVDSFVHHWLTVGPADYRVGDTGADSAHSMPDPLHVTELDRVQLGDSELVWEAMHCQPDHWLSWHGFVSTATHRQTWGFVHLHSAQAQQVTLTLTVNCAARLWLHGELVPGVGEAEGGEILRYAQNDKSGLREVVTCQATVQLKARANPLLLQLETVGVREVSLMAALRVEAFEQRDAALRVQLPTLTRAPRRRQRLEAAYAQTRLDRAVYGKGDPIRLLPPRLPSGGGGKHAPVLLRLQKPSGAIYAETVGTLDADASIESVRGSQLPNGSLDAVVMAPFQEFYTEKLRARHTMPLLIANHPFYATAPTDSAENADQRLIEALRVQAQATGSVYSELAKMAFGWWEQVDAATIERAVERVLEGDAESLPELLGLVTIAARMPAYRGFPPSLLPVLERGLLACATDGAARQSAAWDSDNETNQLAVMAARHLLGQLYPQTQASAPAAETLVAWMAQRGRSGFRQWHSDHDLLVTSLAPLLSLAQDADVRETAASLLDTLAFALALHSFGGTFGASRARASGATLRSGRFAPEAALTRLLWGTGGYATNQKGSLLAATTSLGLAGKSYVLPDAIRAIALHQPASPNFESLWIRERHGDAKVVSYRTPDYLLSSAQSYHPGERGEREQVWQATLGSEALVFSTHPALYSQADAAAPGWWVGNASLPRVAQHHDALIALYALPANTRPEAGPSSHGLDFTHAYFPTYSFDEHLIVDGWAFARVGSGYLALGSLPTLTLVEHGPDGGRELRVEGRAAAWLCQMGRAAVDGDFASFQRRVLASAPQRHEQRVTWTTARGDTLALGMDGPFTVNGQAVSLDDFPRHHSPFAHATFPAQMLEIAVGEDALRLHF